MPLQLPRLLMRRAVAVGAAVWLAAAALGLVRMSFDIDDEVEAAAALAHAMARLGTLATMDDAAALQALSSQAAEAPPRHLTLSVRSDDGRVLLAPRPREPSNAVVQGLLRLHRSMFSVPDSRQATWALQRPGGGSWVVTLSVSHESERAEAMLNLLGMLGLLLGGIAALLLAMRFSLLSAFAPLGDLLQSIAGIERRDTAPLRALPAMPIGELEALAQALRHLSQALDAEEAERRALGQRVITLQEDERARLARELHDEFGQHVTALRADAAWLARRTAADRDASAVVRAIAGHGDHIQQALRGVLVRLRPMGPGADRDAGEAVRLSDLQDMVQSLARGWNASPGRGFTVQVQMGGDLPAPEGTGVAVPPPLALAVHRITQEALTNVARHAQARQARVLLTWHPDGRLDWCVDDDGVGVADPAEALLRGSGLAGIKERIWALGGELVIEPAKPGAARPGTRLRASFRGLLERPAQAA